jgi:hypothetical protein
MAAPVPGSTRLAMVPPVVMTVTWGVGLWLTALPNRRLHDGPSSPGAGEPYPAGAHHLTDPA